MGVFYQICGYGGLVDSSIRRFVIALEGSDQRAMYLTMPKGKGRKRLREKRKEKSNWEFRFVSRLPFRLGVRVLRLERVPVQGFGSRSNDGVTLLARNVGFISSLLGLLSISYTLRRATVITSNLPRVRTV